MATRYSDIITLSKSRTVYNIREEGPNDWKTFIANDQFNNVLDKTIKAIFNNDSDNHKPIWIAGTYGTGKSHAGAVLKHLLCDSKEEIIDYVNLEYKDAKFDVLRTKLLSLRDNKRLFPISLYGQQNITHVDDLSLQIQREIKTALELAGLNIPVRTDFDNYVAHIDQNPDFWTMLIDRSPKLESVAPDIKKLRQELNGGDHRVLDKVNDALRENRLDIRLEIENLGKWIFEIQDKLREEGTYDGLLIVWDEFTEIGKSANGELLLNKLQEVADMMMSEKNDSYFLFISHPSALNLLNEEKRNQTIGRYHYITYNMETVSAFKIMSRKFNVVDEDAHKKLVSEFYEAHADLLDIFSASSNQVEETKKDLQKLYPLHPSTANLATYYAREAGSSSRSVFEFLASDAVRAFFDNEFAYKNYVTITPDLLWDYVMNAFNEDQSKFGAVLERYNSYHAIVEHEGEDYAAVFKGILLLNALNNIAGNATVTPSEENIKNLFIGTEIEREIDNILNYFNEKSIIQRLPGNIFSIQFTALPADEIQNIKNELRTAQFKFTDQVAKFGDTAILELNKGWVNIFRPFKVEVFSQQSNEYTLVNKIENMKKNAKGYEIFIAVLVAKDFDELNFLKGVARNYTANGRFKDMLVIAFDSILEPQNYDRFIDFMANSTCAQRHGLAKQQETYANNAKKMVRDWISKMRGGNFSYYFFDNEGKCGVEDAASGMRFVSTVNNVVSPKIFISGPESLLLIQIRSTKTNWAKSSVRTTVDAMLQFNTKDEVLAKSGGQGRHVDYLLQDSVDNNLEWKEDVDAHHPLKIVCDYIDGVFKKTSKNTEFNLGEKLEALSLPPYGLYQSYAGMAMVAYAMRKYVKQIFDTNGKPRESRHIVDDVVEMFKSWESGKKSNKLNMMFESKESGDLCKRLISIFKLKQLAGYKDVTSLTDARWAILEYATRKGYPLWSLKYIDCDDKMGALIDNITRICDPNGMANQELISSTSKTIKELEIELSLLLSEESRFKRGFADFLKRDDVVKIKDAEIDDAYDYLTKHLQKEIGRWSEVEVSNQLKNWRIEVSSNNITIDGDGGGGTPPPIAPPPGGSGSGKITPAKKDEAINLIEQSPAEDVKSAIKELCQNEDDSILDIILSYVKR